MATEKAANLGRDKISDEIFAKGAHGLAVDKMTVDGEETYGLVAMVPPGNKATFPRSVTVVHRSREVIVPVIVKETEPFKPE